VPPLKPIKRREFIQYLKQLGFEGPFPGGKHETMRKGTRFLVLPNPHHDDISGEFLSDLLKQAGVTRKEWEALK